MSIKNIDIRDGWYGRITPYAKDGEDDFTPYGKAATIEEVYRNIESGEIKSRLAYESYGETLRTIVSRGAIGASTASEELAKIGIDTTKNDYAAFVDSLRLQELRLAKQGRRTRPAYDHLGWWELPVKNKQGKVTGYSLCYRDDKLIGGPENATYTGSFDIRALGSKHVWRSMVIHDVIPYPAPQFILVAALSAPVNGLIAPAINGENPIIHLNYPSGRGKSSMAMLAASTAGCPFDGTITEVNEDGDLVDRQSVYQSWGSTVKALVTANAGNRGAVTVLNELGKNTSNDLTNAIFNLSEGSDLKRLTPSLQTRISQRYTTTFISTGETSLLDKCKDKLEGLSIRVMEVSKPLTVDADHANRIKETCRQHCGHAAWRLAKFIIMRGGLDFVLPIYKDWVSKLRKLMPETPSRDRFIEKFAALFMTSAYIAERALKLPLDMDGLLSFLIEYDTENGESRNTSASAYEVIVEQLRINLNKFYIRDDGRPSHTAKSNIVATPIADSWGRCVNKLEELGGQYIVQEFQVRPSVLEKLLRNNGYDNIDTVLNEWLTHGWIDGESNGQSRKKLKKRLKVDPFGEGKEPVYVLRVFADDEEAEAIRAEQAERARKAQRRPLSRQSTIKLLEQEDDDDATA